MTITLSRNTILFIVAVIALGTVGYFVGTRVGKPATPGLAPGAVVTATLPPVAVNPADGAQVAVATNAPDTAPRLEMADFKKEFDAKKDVLIVDVRSADQYAAGHIVGAVNIPEAEVATRLSELPKDKDLLLYCA